MSTQTGHSFEPDMVSEDVRGTIVALVSAGVSLILDFSGDGLPRVVHWGADLGPEADSYLEAIARTSVPPRVDNLIDASVSVSVLPEARTGWMGSPGIAGSRVGRSWATAFSVTGVRASGRQRSRRPGVVVLENASSLTIDAVDRDARLELTQVIDMTAPGLVRMQVALRNSGDDEFSLDSIELALPVPPRATEIMDFAGRWSKERVPQRVPFTVGRHVREGRRGRTGADAPTVLAAGAPGFGFANGELWCIHLAWSGNHRECAEHTNDGFRLLRAGELLLPGEMTLGPGAEYATPTLFAAWGRGLDSVASRFHEYLRSRPGHPRAPRPVNMNVWEAVYFDQNADVLMELARLGAGVGAERFVLDDGWFTGRRNSDAGLGDWFVDPVRWPEGLTPLVTEVRRLGMTFGLWFEPEMINLDSEVARRHPDWILHAEGRLPPPSRNQQVLDLTNPDAYEYVRGRMVGIISEYEIDYVKWDQNRDLIEAGRSSDGKPGVHLQTLAVYRLMDHLKSRFPTLEIESCSSGGARVDLGVIERADRVWPSDCIDPLERQQIQRWTSQLLPLELVGTHVASETSHTTGRKHSLSFRAQTALLGHFGIECDLRRLTAAEMAELARWTAIYRRFRQLLHSGRLIRGSDPQGERIYTGVVAHDGTEALYSIVALTRTADDPPGPFKLRGLGERDAYAVNPVMPTQAERSAPSWWSEAQAGTPLVLTGAILAGVGVHLPSLLPESGVLLHARRHV